MGDQSSSMATPSISVSFVLSYLLIIFLHLAQSMCPKEFLCSNRSIPTFPFTNKSLPHCGLFMLGCNIVSTPPTLELDGKLYNTLAFGEKDIVVLSDPVLSDHLKNRSCDSFNWNSSTSFINSPSVSFEVPKSQFLFLFKCNQGSSCHSQQKTDSYFTGYKSYRNCKNFTLYYKEGHHIIPKGKVPKDCSLVQLPFYNSTKSNDLFEKLSPEIVFFWKVSEKCSECHDRGGHCQSDSNNNFKCLVEESDVSLVRLILGPSAEVILDTSRPVFDPPSGGYVALSLLAVKYGFRVPPPPLFNEVCRYFNLVPGQLSPNWFHFVATFLSLCDSLSIPPTLSLFTQLFYVAAVGSRSPGSIQIVPREGLRFEGISKSFKRWKERFVFVRPVGSAFDFPTSWPSYYFKLDRPPAPTGVLAQQVQAFRDLGPVQVIACIELEALENDILQERFRRLTRSHTSRSAAPPPPSTEGPGDKGKNPVDEPSAPLAFSSSPPCALADSGALRKRARAEPAGEEPSGSLPQPLTLTVTRWTDSSMCGTRFNYNPLEWGEKVIFPCDQEYMQTIGEEALDRRTIAHLYRELEELDARFKDLTVRYQDQVEASHRSLTTQAELRRACWEAEEGRRVAEESLFSTVSDYKNSDTFRQDALASIRGAPDDFALIGKDWFASPGGAEYAAEMSLEDYYEGSRRMQQEIYATLQSSNPPFMPTDLGLPPPLHSWADHHLNEGPGAPVLGSGVASGAHPPGFAFPSDSGGRREIPFDSAYLNSAANLQVLADLSNAEVSLGPLDSIDGAGPQDVRGDVSSQAPGV
nr:LEAF RUST 10 DISEASE-RESISTANCE LOCUS RECEPTOR-LIKE PROTEIN KINASE-like 2.4 [Ipomoea trifida]